MATTPPHASSRRMYSWWWDNSHISPKNSKWLQENLTDMDVKVKQMIKLIDEDADSFARRAEMYYKKRPELMEMVEDFYRAYRALAERYDHATGVIRQAQRTMTEAFPNQVPMMLTDDLSMETEPHTPKTRHPSRAFFDSDESEKDAHAIKRNGAISEEPNSALNKTDMEVKVKQMIKLIEEDAYSFARRAEMYYKKRPELMKMVEDFYRAYRALAERYDHATGVIRQAQRTMTEAFPNQVPMMLTDDLSMETEPHTPKTRHPSRAFFDSDESEKDAHAIKRNGAISEEPNSALIKTGLRQLNDLSIPEEHANHAKLAEGHARRGLNYKETQEISEINNGGHDTKAQVLSESERVTKAEAEILALKKALAKLEDEKEAGLLQYQQSLEKLSNLELEVSSAHENSQSHDERASNAEAEVQDLKEAVIKLQAEREANLLQYQECLEKISNLEKNISFAQKDAGELNERATRAETEVESLKQDLARVEAEKEAALVQYKQCLETLSKLEERLKEAEETARRINEQANIAEKEIEALKLEVTMDPLEFQR